MFSFTDVPEHVRQEWKNDFVAAINDGFFIGGGSVQQFEKEWANFIGSSFSCGVGNGFDALVLALKALDIKKGDRVLVPAHTFIATWFAIDYVGAIPVGIDVDEAGLMDIKRCPVKASTISAILPVHMHGRKVDIESLVEFMKGARNRHFKIIEDSSQYHKRMQFVTSLTGRRHLVVHSLYPTKNLGALGDAGIVSMNSIEIERFVKTYRNYGASATNKYLHRGFGVNTRLDSLQARFLSTNLRHLEEGDDHRRKIAKIYYNILEGSECRFLHSYDSDSTYHHFVIRVRGRDQLKRYLQTQGIQTDIHYPNLAAHEYSKLRGVKQIRYPRAEQLAKEMLSLPISPWMKFEDAVYVAEVIRRGVTSRQFL
jgi:dTDP-4-amino-4,6-dideoxygalactose transaminase